MGGGDYRTNRQGVEFVEFIPLGEWKVEDLPYPTSWDWLVPVLIKIERECEGVPTELIDVSFYDEIHEVYWAVVKFIKRQKS